MKKMIIILVFGIMTTLVAFSQQDIAQNSDSLRLRNKFGQLSNDTTNANRAYRNQGKDKFIDLDGDGINDNRCGRGMGLKKGNGLHNCLPQTKGGKGCPNMKTPPQQGPKK